MIVAAIEPGKDRFFLDDEPVIPFGGQHDANPKPIKGRGSKSKARKSAPIFNKKTREYWESQGYWVVNLQGWQNVNGTWVSKDYCGCFDYEALKPGERVLIQVSAKGAVREHLGKMLGTREKDKEWSPGQTRRMAMDKFMELGYKLVIHWFDQPGGDGTKWVQGIEEITPELVAVIDSGKRTKRVAA